MSLKSKHRILLRGFLLFALITLTLIKCDKNNIGSIFKQGSRPSDEKIVSLVQSLIDSPYKFGGEDRKGFDCSGLAYYVIKESIDVELPRSSSEQSKTGKEIKRSKAKPGDLIFFKRKKRIFHVGIIVSSTSEELEMIHSNKEKGVHLTNITESGYWNSKIAVIKRMY